MKPTTAHLIATLNVDIAHMQAENARRIGFDDLADAIVADAVRSTPESVLEEALGQGRN